MNKLIKSTFVLATLLMSSLVLADDTAVFTGFNIEENSNYYYVGGVYALNNDVSKEGVILRGQAAYGTYKYDTTGVVGGKVDAEQTRLHAGVGYQWVNTDFRSSVYAGGDLQNHELSPNDTNNNVRGSKDGVITQVEIESLNTPVYYAGIGSYSTAFSTYWVRARGGLPIADLKPGLEVTCSGNESHSSAKFGAFVIAPINKTMAVDVSFGHFETKGDGRADNSGTYVGANLIAQF